jgi:hypothetical protein
VLDLSIAMYKNLVIAAILLLSGWTSPQASLDAEITSPRDGDVLKGIIEIIGTAAGENFATAELAYAYADSENPSWFVIAQIGVPLNVATLAVWDTTTISDGDYRLMLTVNYTDGSSSQYIVERLQVRNYTAAEVTPTAQLTAAIATHAPTFTAVPVAATPFPENRAALSVETVKRNLKTGAILGILCITGLGFYTFVRGWKRRR